MGICFLIKFSLPNASRSNTTQYHNNNTYYLYIFIYYIRDISQCTLSAELPHQIIMCINHIKRLTIVYLTTVKCFLELDDFFSKSVFRVRYHTPASCISYDVIIYTLPTHIYDVYIAMYNFLMYRRGCKYYLIVIIL